MLHSTRYQTRRRKNLPDSLPVARSFDSVAAPVEEVTDKVADEIPTEAAEDGERAMPEAAAHDVVATVDPVDGETDDAGGCCRYCRYRSVAAGPGVTRSVCYDRALGLVVSLLCLCLVSDCSSCPPTIACI